MQQVVRTCDLCGAYPARRLKVWVSEATVHPGRRGPRGDVIIQADLCKGCLPLKVNALRQLLQSKKA